MTPDRTVLPTEADPKRTRSTTVAPPRRREPHYRDVFRPRGGAAVVERSGEPQPWKGSDETKDGTEIGARSGRCDRTPCTMVVRIVRPAC